MSEEIFYDWITPFDTKEDLQNYIDTQERKCLFSDYDLLSNLLKEIQRQYRYILFSNNEINIIKYQYNHGKIIVLDLIKISTDKLTDYLILL